MPDRLQIKHLRTADLNKAPSASTLAYGEIAVNYNAESPNLYIKDSDDNVVGFVSESYFEKIVGTGITENGTTAFTPISEVIQQDEETVAAALNDLNDRKADKEYVDEAVSSITIAVDDHIDSASTNPVQNKVVKEYIDEAVSSITIDIDSELDTGSTNPVANSAVTQHLVDTEYVISQALNDLNTRKADKSYVDTAVSSITIDVDSELDSGSTNPVANSAVTKTIIDNELIVASALNDLNGRVDELSGETPWYAKKDDIIVTSFTLNGSGNVVTSTTLSDKVLLVGKGTVRGVPAYTSSDAGKYLSVNQQGVLEWVLPSYLYTGNGQPLSAQGNNGDLYLDLDTN